MMSETLILAFQSQLSIVMETILKSAMYEITRLVEDSFLEEVGRSRQEVELLREKLDFSENKLKERERERGKRGRCANCDAAGEVTEDSDSRAAQTHTGADALCLSFSLREQGERVPQQRSKDLWPSREKPDRLQHSATHTHTQPQRHTQNQVEQNHEPPHNTPQGHLQVFQKLLSPASVTDIHFETLCDSKVSKNAGETFEGDSPSIRDVESEDCRLQSTPQPTTGTLNTGDDSGSSQIDLVVKSESLMEPVAIKEEEEMMPVCNDYLHPEVADLPQRDFRGAWEREETQVDPIPHLSHPLLQNAMSDLRWCTLSLDTVASQASEVEHRQASSAELALTHISEIRDVPFLNRNRLSQSSNRLMLAETASVPSKQVCAGEKPYSCVQGPKTFSQHKQLRMHEKTHTGKLHPCTQCGKTYLHLCRLKAHLLTHKGKKPLSCPQCDKTFVYNFELKIHQRSHSGEKPFVCGHCGKGFTRLSNFKQHQNIHTQEKLHSCVFCGMRFNRATNLRVHLRRHNNVGKMDECAMGNW